MINRNLFTDAVRFTMKRKRQSLREAAKEVGVSAALIQRISSGKWKNDILLASVERLCEWMEMRLGDFEE